MFDTSYLPPRTIIVVQNTMPLGSDMRALLNAGTASTGIVTYFVVASNTESGLLESPELLAAIEELKTEFDGLSYRWHSNRTPRSISEREERKLLERMEAAERASLATARTARSAPRTKYRPVDRIARWMGFIRH
jgi:hypothetical protein